MREAVKVTLKNRVANGTAKAKSYRMIRIGDEFIPRDCKYPLSGPGRHKLDDVTLPPQVTR